MATDVVVVVFDRVQLLTELQRSTFFPGLFDLNVLPSWQGVLVPGRVQLLMKPGDTCFRGYGRRDGERRRKSVRGCIVSQDLSVLNLVIVKRGACILSVP